MGDISDYYSPTGAGLIERFYSPDYLSIGGKESTEILARDAEITTASIVLDVGSGLGGPALHLAKAFGCRVTGLDIVESNVRIAAERARSRSLDHLASFRVGDGTAMPFEDGRFDVVMSQDAWTHVADRDKLIGECRRVLRPDGIIAFTDWLQTGDLSDDRGAETLDAMAATKLATADLYCCLLQKHGFRILKQEDLGMVFLGHYDDILERIDGLEAEISGQFSPRLFAIVRAKNKLIRDAFAHRILGGARLIARKT